MNNIRLDREKDAAFIKYMFISRRTAGKVVRHLVLKKK